MSVSIKVGIRCRPFVCDDKLGVDMQQPEEEGGTVELLNSEVHEKLLFLYVVLVVSIWLAASVPEQQG